MTDESHTQPKKLTNCTHTNNQLIRMRIFHNIIESLGVRFFPKRVLFAACRGSHTF